MVARSIALTTWLVLTAGCDRLKWEDERIEGSADTEPLLPELLPEAKPQPPTTPSDAGDLPSLERAKRKLAFPAKGAMHLGFNLQALEGVHALAGAVEVPAWAASGDGDTRALRDDDLGHGWTCTPEIDRPCAIGVHLATTAELKAVRLYALPPGPKALVDSRRLARVRLHTDEGWADAEITDAIGYAYVLLGKAVRTRTVVIEVLELRGREKLPLVVSDLELFGIGGTARDPIELDPQQMIVRGDGPSWSKVHAGWGHGAAFLEVLADDGTTRRVLPGTAIHGRAEDRILLVEALDHTDCRTHLGSYVMLDRVTRVQAPVGDLGGLGGRIFRAQNGLGFASGYVDELEARLTGVVLEGESYKHRRTQRVSDLGGPQQLAAWGMDAAAAVHGGVAINQPLEGCTLGSDDTMAVLAKSGASKAVAKPGEWMICPLGDGVRAFVTDHGPCGKSWEIVVLDGKDAVVASRDAKRKGARVRLRRQGTRALLVEVGGSDDATELLRVGADAITSLGPTGLAALPPAACRARCDDALRNPAQR